MSVNCHAAAPLVRADGSDAAFFSVVESSPQPKGRTIETKNRRMLALLTQTVMQKRRKKSVMLCLDLED